MYKFKNLTHVRYFDLDGKEELVDIKEFAFSRFKPGELHDISVLDEWALPEGEEKKTIVKTCLYIQEKPNSKYHLDVIYLDNLGYWIG